MVGSGEVVGDEVEVRDVVPADLATTARRCHDAGAALIVRLVPPALDEPARSGWEIGAIAAALDAGADEVRGVDPRRVARVRAVVERLR